MHYMEFHVLTDDPFYEILSHYPACVVDFSLIQSVSPHQGLDSHRAALDFSMRRLSDAGGANAPLWDYDVSRAQPQKISPQSFLSLTDASPQRGAPDPGAAGSGISYVQAFLFPPHGPDLPAAAFREINAALFPFGPERLEAYVWTTDWSGYFDEGREWWGTLCLSVYDSRLARYAVILASATD